MKIATNLLKVLVLFIPALGFAATDLVFPWVTDNANFRGTVIVNNLNNTEVTVTMTAVRPANSGATDTETIQIVLGPLEQLVSTAGNLFTQMGSVPPAYTVRLTSDADAIEAGLVVSATSTASGDSPSQANVVPASDASQIILFSYLPNDGSGFSAPVVLNMGDVAADVIYRAYQNGQEVDMTTRSIGPGRPFAEGVNTLFPDVFGDIFVVCESPQPLLGLAFIFNSLGEPSMANAKALNAVPSGMTGGGGVSFAGVIQPIFPATCATSSCHAEPTNSSGLNLAVGNAYNNIINIASIQNPSLNLVTPGNPDDSYLYRKLLGTGIVGFRMPRAPNPPLSDTEIALVRDWITEGALNN